MLVEGPCHSEGPWACGQPIEMEVNLSSPPAEAGVHVPDEVDSRLRGNDVVGVTFERAQRGISPCSRVDRGRKLRARFLSRDCGIGMTALRG